MLSYEQGTFHMKFSTKSCSETARLTCAYIFVLIYTLVLSECIMVLEKEELENDCCVLLKVI